ncbi:hypothetical protein TRFO_10511 [Tritrichomonas foetus]|uniref:Uncharacterized protein n=1 Tax=Tritrichomonas foetus TaxID=1144522 RepID=A0A1J4JDP8_9EUKA|nr:hypothetical protein TRFO_10511 [Tritrichomonas foetus]|eukprot:OHS95380.1 hypothetical protein TRFO_10511 [Tritrichomonas foetus]
MSSNEKEKHKITFETESDLNDSITQVVADLNEICSKDDHLEQYVYGINQMFDMFSDIYRRNVRLLEKVQDLNTQIVVNASKVSMISKTTDQDKDSLNQLKTEFDEAAKMVNFAHQAETKSKEILAQLRNSIETLSSQINNGEAFTFGEETSIFEVSQDVKNLQNECQKGILEIDEFKAKIEEKNLSLEGMRKNIHKMKEEADGLQKSLNSYDNKLDGLNKEVSESYEQLVEVKPIVPSQKAELDLKIKEKTKLGRNVVNLKQSHYSSLSVLGQLRDESKGWKEKGGRRARMNAELKKTAQSKIERIEVAKAAIASAEDNITGLRLELEKQKKVNDELKLQYEQLLQSSDEMSKQKSEVRKELRTKRPKLVELQFEIAKVVNEAQMDSRKVISSKISLTAQSKLLHQEKRVTHEVENNAKQTKSTIRNTKPQLQNDKDKFVGLLREIDSKRGEKFKILAQTQMVTENMELTNEENVKQMKELKLLKEKSERQDDLSEELRDDRNTYKRLLEEKEAENKALTIQNDQLSEQIHELQTKFMNMLKETGYDHLKCRTRLEEISGIEAIIETLHTNIHTTERMISRLQAEYQTLNHVLRDAQHDHLQQKKERQLLVNNQQIILQDTYAKNKKIEDLRDKICSTEAYLKRCSSMYKEKETEILNLMDQLKNMEARTAELEAKREKLTQMEYKMHRMVAATIVEKQKCMTLIHEFSVPRNVHRWQVVGAVDQAFAKNIQFRTEISAKIEAAHSQLCALKEERDKLKEALEKMKTVQNTKSSKEEVQNAIDAYIQDIKRMDRELSEMKKQYKQNKPSERNSESKVTKVRSSLVQRRGNTNTIKNEIAAAVEPDPAKLFFITENPLMNPMLGGGFSIKHTAQSALNRSVPKPLVGPVGVPASRNTKRYVPSILSQAPTPVQKVHHGINFILPSMP